MRLDEVENGIVSGYEVSAGNRADQQQWAPALEHHVALFGRAPRLAATDRGYWSTHNEEVAAEMGVKHVVLPARGPLSAERAVREKSGGSGADRHGARELSRGSPPSNIVLDCSAPSAKEKRDLKDTSPFACLRITL